MSIKNLYKLVIISIALLITGCAFTPSSFNQSNIDRLYVGMSATSVRQIFGSPVAVSSSVCGANSGKGSWVCETWKYPTSNSYIFNEFTFSVDTNVPGIDGKTLNNWSIRKQSSSF